MADRDVSISFARAGIGWADCTIRVGTQRLVLDGIGYTTDALGDLVRATLQVVSGGIEATVAFDREPAEWRLFLRAHDPVLFLRVMEFADINEDTGVELGNECFKAECDLQAFAQAVVDAAAAILADETRAEWWSQDPFPFRAYIGLRATLSAPREAPPTSP